MLTFSTTFGQLSKQVGWMSKFGLAGGFSKIDAIYGALKGKIINIIITDKEVAEELIKK